MRKTVQYIPTAMFCLKAQPKKKHLLFDSTHLSDLNRIEINVFNLTLF